jgi:hypothetical protein
MDQVAQQRVAFEWCLDTVSIGANYIQAGMWRGFAVRDLNLSTGQQNFSGSETVEAVIALGE